MASVKIQFRGSSVAGREGTIFFRVIVGRKTRRINTDYHLFPGEWNNEKATVVSQSGTQREEYLRMVKGAIHAERSRINKIIHNLDMGGAVFTAGDVVAEYNSYVNRYSLFQYMEVLIAKMKGNGKLGTARTYHAALRSFRKFRDGKDMLIDSITTETMEAYEAWLTRRGVIPNTISFYIRILRAVYNRVVEQDVIEDRRPFRHVYTGIDKTVKRALPLRSIRKIKTMNLSEDPRLDYARDMFMLSFYLRGMSFIDMAFLRKDDLKEGYVTYRRHKTGRRLTIAWTQEMQSILDKYPENNTDYLLPIIRNIGINELFAYRNAAYYINRSLRRIGTKSKTSDRLTMYVARHSWASVAKSKGVPLSVISEGMGHDSESTTRIYLASLETSVVDRANSLIISSL